MSDSGTNYLLRNDGAFESAPSGLGGRTFDGFWTLSGGKVEAQAKRGWVNGVSGMNDFCKIVFYIGAFGSLEKRERAPVMDSKRESVAFLQTYWFIDFLSPIVKPKDFDARQAKAKVSRAAVFLVPSP